MNDAGQTGIGNRTPIVQRPTAVYGAHRFVLLTAGSRHTCGITVGGETLCWGANSSLQLGINTTRRGCQLSQPCTAVPAPIDDPKDFVVLNAGQDKTCGITRIGALYCWGYGYGGIMEDKPLALTRIGSSMTFSDVSPGYWFTCGLAVGGKAYCWKEDDHAIIGQSLIRWGCHDAKACIDETPVSAELRFRALASGQAHACGITIAGAVYCWGLKSTEKIGERIGQCELGKPDPTHECSSEPVRVGGELNVLATGDSPRRSKP
jgi:alpha-tubulin suppressor-like RCC1 family protein